MPSSVIRSYPLRPRAAPAGTGIRLRPRYRYHDVPEETWRGHAAGLLQGRIFQREHPRSLSLHARELTMHAPAAASAMQACAVRRRHRRASSTSTEFITAGGRSTHCSQDCEATAIPAFRVSRLDRQARNGVLRLALRLQRSACARCAAAIPDFLLPLRERAPRTRRRRTRRRWSRRWWSATTWARASAGIATARCSTGWSAISLLSRLRAAVPAPRRPRLPAFLRVGGAAALRLSTERARSVTNGSTASRPMETDAGSRSRFRSRMTVTCPAALDRRMRLRTACATSWHSTPFDAGYCHCAMCRRSSGAPVMAFATVPFDDLVVTCVARCSRRRSTSFGDRWFLRRIRPAARWVGSYGRGIDEVRPNLLAGECPRS